MKLLLLPFHKIGDYLLKTVDHIGFVCILTYYSLWAILRSLTKWREILYQIYICGVQSLAVTLFVGTLIGMILALQTGFTLRQFQLQDYIGTVVLVTICKELGPFMTAFILTGRVGAAFAAELGTMKVSEEIDALEVMSSDPIRFLVMPRVLALVLFTPILTIYCNIIGVIGGGIVGFHQIGVSSSIYYKYIFEYLETHSLEIIYGGILKSIVFGLLIAVIGCSNGLRAVNGAEGVGKAARKSVVESFLMILLFNYIMSSLINTFWY
jgi:phospholipid/cholesterol/gamma-HCH transport system permease protein